jgi:fructose-1,6-bisphosphatase/inositol monophosphatase family enzyme
MAAGAAVCSEGYAYWVVVNGAVDATLEMVAEDVDDAGAAVVVARMKAVIRNHQRRHKHMPSHCSRVAQS